MVARDGVWIAGLVVLGACATPRTVSDTGFVGTWSRGTEISLSSMTIVRDPAGAGFLWRGQVNTADGKLEVRCAWRGECSEHVEGQETARFRCTLAPEPGRDDTLRLECTGQVLLPVQERRPLHYVKRLALAPGGLSLVSTMLERDGYHPPGEPRLEFGKLDDRVLDPPSGG